MLVTTSTTCSIHDREFVRNAYPRRTETRADDGGYASTSKIAQRTL